MIGIAAIAIRRYSTADLPHPRRAHSLMTRVASGPKVCETASSAGCAAVDQRIRVRRSRPVKPIKSW